MARVALDRTPDLPRGFGVAGQGGDAAFRAQDGGIDAKSRPGIGEQNAVSIGEEVLDAGVAQEFIHAGAIATLGEPDALRSPPKGPLKLAGAEFNLHSGRGFVGHERQKSVRRAAGDEFELAALEKPPKAIDQVIAILVDEDMPRAGE